MEKSGCSEIRETSGIACETVSQRFDLGILEAAGVLVIQSSWRNKKGFNRSMALGYHFMGTTILQLIWRVHEDEQHS